MDQLSYITWAMKWKIPPEALRELSMMSLDVTPSGEKTPEGEMQQRIRLAEARKGNFYYRNNRGANKLENGMYVRWGLCNDSPRVGDRYKSGDLIGAEPTVITQEMVGSTVAIFGSIECKASNWKFAGTKEELAQVAWATLINSIGGRARIVNHD